MKAKSVRLHVQKPTKYINFIEKYNLGSCGEAHPIVEETLGFSFGKIIEILIEILENQISHFFNLETFCCVILEVHPPVPTHFHR